MKEFKHCQYAHCESGVLSSLISHSGLNMSEPMVFGLTSTLSFVYLPIVKLNNLPLISYRDIPKNIIKNLPRLLKVDMVKKSFKSKKEATAALDRYLNEGKLIGLQTSVFFLPYFPNDMRFHFNAHNLIVCKKEENRYLISDPVFEDKRWCDEDSLVKARFAKGVFAPNGFLYFLEDTPKELDLSPIIKKALHKNAKKMLTPFPYAGINGMTRLAKKIESFNKKSDKRYLINYLTHIVRMQEEIGTGGGGFRYLYSAFLQEAKDYKLDNNKLELSSNLLINSGDKLREFALLCVKNCKDIANLDTKKISSLLLEVRDIEKEAFTILKSI